MCAVCQCGRWQGRLGVGRRRRRSSWRESQGCWEVNVRGVQACHPWLNSHIPGNSSVGDHIQDVVSCGTLLGSLLPE